VRGYTDTTRLEVMLGRELTGDELARFDWVGPAVESYLERVTGRQWLGTVTGENVDVWGVLALLKSKPIASVQAVRTRLADGTLSTLTVTTDYVVEAAQGIVRLVSWTAYDPVYSSELTRHRRLEVDYTLPTTMPDDLREAATLLTVAWLQGERVGSSGEFKSLKLGDDTYTFSETTPGSVPDTVTRLLSTYGKRAVLV
jgi:hypothetical protein